MLLQKTFFQKYQEMGKMRYAAYVVGLSLIFSSFYGWKSKWKCEYDIRGTRTEYSGFNESYNILVWMHKNVNKSMKSNNMYVVHVYQKFVYNFIVRSKISNFRSQNALVAPFLPPSPVCVCQRLPYLVLHWAPQKLRCNIWNNKLSLMMRQFAKGVLVITLLLPYL